MSDVVAAWEEALRAAYSVARGEALATMKGNHPKRYDSRGLHVLSLEVGRIQALQEIEPVLREADFDPLELMHEARLDARDTFAKEWMKTYAVNSQD